MSLNRRLMLKSMSGLPLLPFALNDAKADVQDPELVIKSEEVVAKTRKLDGEWSYEPFDGEAEVRQLVDRWDGTRLLHGHEGESKRQLAVLLENQRLFNEWFDSSSVRSRLSIPLVRRVFDRCTSRHIVPWHPMILNEQVIHFQNEPHRVEHKIQKILSSVSVSNRNSINLRSFIWLDKDAENVAALATEIAEKIDTNLFDNLKRYEGTGTFENHISFEDAVVKAFALLRKNGIEPTWMWVDAHLHLFNYKEVGLLHNLKFVESKLDFAVHESRNRILIGGEVNYCYCPYLLIDLQEEQLGNDNVFRTPVLVRAGEISSTPPNVVRLTGWNNSDWQVNSNLR